MENCLFEDLLPFVPSQSSLSYTKSRHQPSTGGQKTTPVANFEDTPQGVVLTGRGEGDSYFMKLLCVCVMY